MYLKKLEIQGFKSFADKVTLNFEKGVTAIVGPNGSGKSNISDAIRLVLGEQSIKSLRGSKLEDVIFAGSETRKPLGFCEINLTLDNSDGYLPFEYTEVVITRKIFRSGESEFFINKTPCRLKDIYELFLDTGVGKEGYSIIGQGRIEEILSAKPEDRRRIFEEAIGISKYRYKKEEAEKKLAAANDNLIRLNDIISELEKQLTILEAQKIRAEEFLKFKQEKRKADVSLYAQLAKKSMAQYDVLNEKYDTLRSQLDVKKMHKTNQEENLLYKEREIREVRQQLDGKKEEYHNRLREIEIVTGKRELMIEKLKNLEETSDLYNEELKKAESRKEILKEELKRIESDIAFLYARKRKLEETLKGYQEKYFELQKKKRQETEEVEKAKEDIIEILNKIADVKGKLSLNSSLKEEAVSRQQNLKEYLDEIQNQIEILNKDKTKTIELIKILQKDLEEKNQQKLIKQQHLQKIDNELILKESTLKTIKEEIERKKSRLSVLEEMDKNYEGYSGTVRNLLKLSENIPSFKESIIGVIGELLQVENAYSTAIEVALGSSIQNIVVKSSESVAELIEILKQKNLGRATFLPLDLIRGRGFSQQEINVLTEEGVIGVASKLIKYDNNLEEIFNFLLGRVLVIDTIENAIRISKKYNQAHKIVTLEGEVINPGGSITGGSLKPKFQSIFKRKEEIAELREELDNLKKKEKILGQEIEQKVKDRIDHQKLIQLLEKEISDINYNITSNSQIKNSLEKETKNLQNQVENYSLEIEGLKGNVINYQQEINHFLEELEILGKEKKQLETLINSFKEKNTKQEEDLSTLDREITTLKIEMAKLEEKLQNELHNLNNKRQELEREKDNIKDKESNIKEIEDLKVSLMADKEKLKNEIYKLQKEVENIQKDIAAIEDDIYQKEEDLQKQKEKFLIFEQDFNKAKEEFHKLEMEMQRYRIEIDNIKNRLWEEYELSLDRAFKEAEEGEISKLRQRSEHLGKAIKELGNVNIDAIEEYKEVKERYDFLKSQMEDIIKAKETLVSVIEEANKIIKVKFKDGFEILQIQFKETFRRLFGGGNADLILTDEDNLLETGIEIKVQPPGKKLQTLSLLSGGEKALVAISLLFAMLLMRPTPFCVLDEIDAALDDANVERFAGFLKELSKETQFIVVTHRKGTMLIANTIYGVTMEEKGVSKLLSLKLNFDDKTGGLVKHA
ncbi:MAG TPA: chromosome segregation protein SMC [Clostridia bacterium]|nr:chromosome segregation protein SMC [Clostridia bacterium]